MGKKKPTFPESYWQDSVQFPSFATINADIETDVVIIGAGITGITTAYLLTKAGARVILVDAGTICNGTTGHTTAKLTAQHDLIYDELIQHIGEQQTKAYFEANIQALSFIKDTIESLSIDCDYSKEDAYLYTIDSAKVDKLETEAKAYQQLGIDGEFVKSLPLALGEKAGLIMRNQAQFHPLKYLKRLIEEIERLGGKIFEQTTIVDIEEGNKPQVVTRNGCRLRCQNVVIASHFPCYDKGFYFTRMYANRSYVLAIKPEKKYPGGMYLSVDGPRTRSLRRVPILGKQYVLVGGEGHKTGQGICTSKHYEELETFAEETMGIEEYSYRWSTQDLISLDKIPYIGRLTAGRDNIYVATGYRKWGMSQSAVAAQLLHDLIVKQRNPYEELYSPSRLTVDPSVKHFISQNTDVAGHFVAGKFGITFTDPVDLDHDEGSIVFYNGERCGAYKDQEGKVYLVDSTCTHLGCEVEWNSGDRTWDCPCHGSRYSTEGEVLEGPARQALAKVEWKDE